MRLTNDTKKCNAITKKKTKCSKSTYFYFYCKQHWKMRIFSWWGLVFAVVSTTAVFLGFFVDGKEFIKEIKDGIKKEPDYWYCEQDQNIRGELSIFNNTAKDSVFYIRYLEPGIMFELSKEDGRNDYFCYNPINENNKYDDCTIRLEYDPELGILFSMEAYDTQDCLVGLIEKNNFLINEDCTFIWNMDDRAFEIVDNNYKVILSIERVNGNQFKFQGIIPDPSEKLYTLISNTELLNKFSRREIEEKLKKDPIKRLFSYTGKDYIGKRIDSK
jgi:hypothetical protein